MHIISRLRTRRSRLSSRWIQLAHLLRCHRRRSSHTTGWPTRRMCHIRTATQRQRTKSRGRGVDSRISTLLRSLRPRTTVRVTRSHTSWATQLPRPLPLLTLPVPRLRLTSTTRRIRATTLPPRRITAITRSILSMTVFSPHLRFLPRSMTAVIISSPHIYTAVVLA